MKGLRTCHHSYEFTRRCREFMSSLLAVVCACAIPVAALGAVTEASRSLTLIPSEVISAPGTDLRVESVRGITIGQISLLRFETKSLPDNITITKATLRLKWNKQDPGENKNRQTIRVVALKNDNWDEKKLKSMLGKEIESVKDDEDLQNLFANINLAGPEENSTAVETATWSPGWNKAKELTTDGKDGKTHISLLLLPTGDNGKRAWYPISAQEPADRPRLIISYTVEGEKAPAVAQSDGLPAVQSPRAFLPEKNPSAQKAYFVRTVTANSSTAPVFYRDRVYILTKDNKLQALSPLGSPVGKPVETKLLGTDYHLALSQSGRLFIVGNGWVRAYQIRDKELIEMNAGERAYAIPSVAPVVGPAGNLYFVHAFGKAADEVWGLNPDLQELWKVTLGATTEKVKSSRLTVGPSGTFVYLVTQNEGLVAINTQTGEHLKKPLPNQKNLKQATAPVLHAPVIFPASGKMKIYVAASTDEKGVFASVDNTVTKKKNGLTTGRLSDKWEKIDGLFSQPLLDKQEVVIDSSERKKIYSVRLQPRKAPPNADLVAIDWVNLEIVPVKTGNPFNVGANPHLITGGNLVKDRGGNVFVYNGDVKTPYLKAFSANLPPIPDAGLNKLSHPQLMFGGDGTLYANNSDNTLFAILPQYTLSGKTENTDIYSPTHLRIDGTAGENKNWVMAAGGCVLFGKNFAVKKGTPLKVRVGVETESLTGSE